MNGKKLIALLLAVVMVLSFCACGTKAAEPEKTEPAAAAEDTSEEAAEEASSIPSYLHPNQEPLTDESITLRVAVLCDDAQTDPENSWVYAYIEQVLGINIELEYFYGATRDESIALMMADGNLPDMMIGMGFSAEEITNYGESQGLFLDMAPYINEVNAPNLTEIFTNYPQVLDELTTPTGHVYTLGDLTIPGQPVDSYRYYYNYDLMEAMGYTSVPETLDEFVQMLRDMKAYGEANGENIVPFGGNKSHFNGTYFLLNSLGYNRSMLYNGFKNNECSIYLRDGEVVMPCYDTEVFTTYLETLHTMYEEGLMEKDYYTQDDDTVKAHLTSGMYGTFSEVPGLYGGVEFGSQWYGATPLTSESNDTPFWPNYTGLTIGGFAISADTEYPELCVAFADYVCGDNCMLFYYGPNVNQSDIFLDKVSGWYYDHDNYTRIWPDYEENKDKYENKNAYRYSAIGLWKSWTFSFAYDADIYTDEDGVDNTVIYATDETDIMEIAKLRKTYPNYDMQFKSAQVLGWCRYLTDEFTPTTFYFDEATNERVIELQTLIEPYAQQEIAKFVVGERSLDEVNDFYAELEALGAAEYVQYYADYYAATK